jgi:hypothetical protein
VRAAWGVSLTYILWAISATIDPASVATREWGVTPVALLHIIHVNHSVPQLRTLVMLQIVEQIRRWAKVNDDRLCTLDLDKPTFLELITSKYKLQK